MKKLLISDSNNITPLSFELIRIANFHIQIINGKITGNCGEELITITAFDSSYWIIETNLDSLINKIKGRFESVRDISNESINYGN